MASYTYDVGPSGWSRQIDYPGRSGPNTPAVTETYDARGRFAGVQVADVTSAGFGVTWTFDPANRRAQTTRGNGVTTVYGYDVDSRLTSLRHHQSGADMYNVTYYYDAAGNRTALRNHVRTDHSERYWYDGANRLWQFRRGTMHPTINNILPAKRLVDPVKTGEEWWELDKRGNWTEYWEMLNDVPYVDDGYSDERTANAANEYTAITPTGESAMTPDHDANGNLTSMSVVLLHDWWAVPTLRSGRFKRRRLPARCGGEEDVEDALREGIEHDT